MGLIAMSERDLQRIEILSKVVAGRMTMASAAHVLDLSERQVRRLLERIRTGGAASIRHKAIGRPSNNRISDEVRDYAMTLVRERYADFGPTLATEKLAERDGLRVSRETVRGWMSEAGLWLSRKQRRTFHQPRLRREAYGELVQIDGSEHRWFEDRGPPCSLLVFVDDATGRLMQLRFVRSESAFTYFEALELYLHAAGPFGQGAQAFWHRHHGGWQCVLAGLHGGLQCAICNRPCPPGQPAPAAESGAGSVDGEPISHSIQAEVSTRCIKRDPSGRGSHWVMHPWRCQPMLPAWARGPEGHPFLWE